MTFELTTTTPLNLTALSAPKTVRIRLLCHEPTVSTGDVVRAGTLVAISSKPDVGHMHSSITGTVTETSGGYIIIEKGPGESAANPQARDLAGLDGPELASALQELGLDTGGLTKAEILIVNGVPPEPGITAYSQILQDFQSELIEGLTLAQKLVKPKKTFLALAQGSGLGLNSVPVFGVRPIFPNGLDPMVVKAVTGRENPEGVTVIDMLELFHLGRAATTGLPITETIVSVGNDNYKALTGTPVGMLLEAAGLNAENGDRVVMGGPLQGCASESLDQGLDKKTCALALVRQGSHPPVTDAPCISCGECVLICPSRIRPDLISRCAEFKLFERARGYHLDACMECGLCGYVCPSRRPVLQYIRLAKHELDLLDAAKKDQEKGGEQ